MPSHRRRRAEAVVRDLTRALPRANDALEVIDLTAQTLLSAVPADVWCGVILDPSTLLDTGGQHRFGFPSDSMPRLFEIEHAEQDDVDNLRRLAGRPDPVSLLSASTRGHLEDSKYYRDILRPLGLADELRVLLRQGSLVWGLLVLCRTTGSTPFSDEDLAAATAVSAPATAELRRSLLLSGTDTGAVPDAPGLVMLDRSQEPVAVSPTGQRWLDDLQEDHADPGRPVPYAVHAVATRAAVARHPAPVRSRARTRSGRWLSLHAWQIEAHDQPMTAVSLGPADPGDLAAIVLDVYNLTTREREVTQQILLGHSTAQIARALGISSYTVQDHLKSVFDKTGVRSRRDLISDLFFRHYLPRLAAPTLSTDGRLQPLTIDPSGPQ